MMPSTTSARPHTPWVSINGMLIRVQITFDTTSPRQPYNEPAYGAVANPETLESTAVTAAANLAARIFHEFLYTLPSDETQTYHARCLVLQRPPRGTGDGFGEDDIESIPLASDFEEHPTSALDIASAGHPTMDEYTADYIGKEASELGGATNVHEPGCPSSRHIHQECHFGTPCGVPITDASLEAIEKHLLEYHRTDLACGTHCECSND